MSLAAACGGGDSRPIVSVGEVGSPGAFELITAAFGEGGKIPARYTCEGEDRSIPLEWTGAPDETQAYAVVLDDPDAPDGTFKHWIIFDIDGSETGMREGIDKTAVIVGGAVQPQNDFGRTEYGDPCPPSGTTHRYQVFIFALSERLGLPASASHSEVLDAIEEVVLARASVKGVYDR
jgi:Raf kinase inhibitor-like YbhB/YbcL family protein